MKKNKPKPSKRKRARRGQNSESFLPELRVSRHKVSVSALTAPSDEVAYWQSRSPAERLAYLKYLRLINYGEAAVSGRLKRVFEIAQLGD